MAKEDVQREEQTRAAQWTDAVESSQSKSFQDWLPKCWGFVVWSRFQWFERQRISRGKTFFLEDTSLQRVKHCFDELAHDCNHQWSRVCAKSTKRVVVCVRSKRASNLWLAYCLRRNKSDNGEGVVEVRWAHSFAENHHFRRYFSWLALKKLVRRVLWRKDTHGLDIVYQLK